MLTLNSAILLAGCITLLGNASALTFNATLSRQIMNFAGIAYSAHPSKCLAGVDGDFQVIKQFTTADGFGTSCAAFLAASSKLNVIVLAYQGTKDTSELIKETIQALEPSMDFPSGGKVHKFWGDAHKDLWPHIKGAIKQQLEKQNADSVVFYITGHSLGGSLAALAAAQLRYENILPANQVKVFTYGEPRTGNYNFAKAYNQLVPETFRVVHSKDPIPHLPFCDSDFTWRCKKTSCFHHGTEIFYPDKAMTVKSAYTICEGSPFGEDTSCSDYYVVVHYCGNVSKCVDYHLYYYGVRVSQICPGKN